MRCVRLCDRCRQAVDPGLAFDTWYATWNPPANDAADDTLTIAPRRRSRMDASAARLIRHIAVRLTSMIRSKAAGSAVQIDRAPRGDELCGTIDREPVRRWRDQVQFSTPVAKSAWRRGSFSERTSLCAASGCRAATHRPWSTTTWAGGRCVPSHVPSTRS
jgi:hypothetical protein